jgi:hypothetical protein
VASTCQADCDIAGSSGCCGNGVCESIENRTNCPVDCNPYVEPGLNRPYQDATAPGYNDVWTLSIGKSGQNAEKTLFFGGKLMVTSSGGDLWQETSSDPSEDPASLAGPPFEAWAPRGNTNYVDTFQVVTEANPSDPPNFYVLYGDHDNLLMASYDGGKSFTQEGRLIGQSLDITGPSVTAILLEPNPPAGCNCTVAYVGISTGDGIIGGSSGGIVKGTLDHSMKRWTWEPLGEQSSSLKGGNIQLARDPTSGKLFAAVAGKGVLGLDAATNTWMNLSVGNEANWHPTYPGSSGQPGDQWKIRRLAFDSSGRLYAGAGYSISNPPTSPNESGVWISEDSGKMSWTKITPDTMDDQPVVSLALGQPIGATHPIVLVGTFFAYTCGYDRNYNATRCSQEPDKGGLYRGYWDSQLPGWHFDHTLHQPDVSGIAVYPGATPGVVYAFATQFDDYSDSPGINNGIYKSLDLGMTWLPGGVQGAQPLANDGLMNVRNNGQLFVSSIPPYHTLYASTQGGGVYAGTITCGPTSEGFPDADNDGISDCNDACTDRDQDNYGDATFSTTGCPGGTAADCRDTDASVHPGAIENWTVIATCHNGKDDNCDGNIDIDCGAAPTTIPTVLGGEGQVSGAIGNVQPLPDGDLYQALTETRAAPNKPYKTSIVYKITVPTTFRNIPLWFQIEALDNSNDGYEIRYAAVASSCPTTTNNQGWSSPLLTLANSASEPGTPLLASVGPASTSVWCFRIQDTQRSSDSVQSTLNVDRIFLLPQ